MRWIARICVFTVTFLWGACAVSLFGDLRMGSGLSDCVVDLGPSSVRSSQPPKGVRVMYAGWQPESDESPAALRFVAYNGLDVPITYLGSSPTEPVADAWIDGKKFEQWTCQFRMSDYQISPGASAEVFATRWDFPRQIRKEALVAVGFYFDLPPRPDRSNPYHDILAITEPFNIPDDFRTARLP